MRVFALIVALCVGGIFSQSSAQVSSATPPSEGLYGEWRGRILGGYSYDDPRRVLVINKDGSCRWDFSAKEANPGSTKSCAVKAGGVELVTGGNSRVVLSWTQAAGNGKLSGTFQIASGASFPLTFVRGNYPAPEARVAATPADKAEALTVTMPDGRAVPFEKVPVVEKFRGEIKLPAQQQAWIPWVAVMSTPAFCPSAWAYATTTNALDRWQATCTNRSRSRLEDYPATIREGCACVRVIEGMPSSLKAVSEIVNDPYAYTIITLVVTRQNAREKLRGFVGRTAAGVYRIFNEKGRLVCSPLDPAGTDRTAFTCFDGRVNAKGTYRVISAKTSISDNYGLGTFQLSDGSQLDMAIGILDRDLFARHPEFPR